jgi:PEP-CTERM motif
MKHGLAGGLAAIGMFALAGHSQAAVLTIDLNDYASAVDTTPGVLMGTMVATDKTGGVSVVVTLVNAQFFAVSGGQHVTIAWNLDTPTDATGITSTPTQTWAAKDGQSPPGCSVACGSFTNGIQGTSWSGTSNSFAGPVTFFLAGITTADFLSNSAGFMGAIDALGPAGTGEIAGAGTLSSVPEPSTWAMMLIGFAGLAYAGLRKAKGARALSIA